MLTLMLHRVLPEAIDNYYYQRGTAISQKTFLALLDAVAASGLPVVTSQSAAQCGVFFSFDDGYADNAWAFEQLLQRGWSAVLFPVKSYIRDRFSVMDDLAAQQEACTAELSVGMSNRLRRLCRQMTATRYRFWRRQMFGIDTDACRSDLFLSEAELVSWSRLGVQLGIHGVTHRIWSVLSLQQLRWEIEQSERWLCSLSGKLPVSMAFPHGKEPTCEQARNLLNGRLLFGVDREYAYSRVQRRVWFTESSDAMALLDNYQRALNV